MPDNQQQRRLLATAIRNLRNEGGFSQEKLAERANLSAIFISRIERGVESPSFDSLCKIAKALRVRVRDLVQEV